MEELALLNKPEIRTEIYRKRISVAETRKATLRMLPGLELSSGENYSSNSFLHNKAWTAASAQVTWNIFNILSGPAAIKHGKANEAVADHRRMALQMAVLTKVHLAYRDYLHRRYQLGRATELDDLEAELTGYIRNAAQKRAKSKLELIQAEVSALSAKLNRNNAYASLQDALGYVYDSMGIDPLGQNFNKTDLTDMRGQLASNLGTWTKAESAPFNWACYAPKREDLAYDESNFRVPEKEIAQAIAEVSKEQGMNNEALAERVAEKVAEKVASKMAEKVAARVAEKMDMPVAEEAQVQAVMPVQPAPAPKVTKQDVLKLDQSLRTVRKFETVQFGSAALGISPVSAAKLDRAASFLREHPDLKIEVVGFSDNSGSLVQAHQDSTERARSVYRYLIERGVDRNRVVIKGYGPASPVASNTTAEGRSENRRVELYVIKYPFDYTPLVNKQRLEQLKQADARNPGGLSSAATESMATEASKVEEARMAAEARKLEEARMAAEARKAEQVRMAAEARKLEDARMAAEARKAEQARNQIVTQSGHLARVAFAGNNAISSGGRDSLDQAASYLKAHPDVRADVIGFSDNSGSNTERYDASVERAR
ncbi:MAG: OmpA family protein, partial [Mariprofundaceae bacterium]|nr:OmpA family protein [Mariprofundaceae bacterium]